MPSMIHEVLVDLFKNRPVLAAELLAEALKVALPAYAQARLASIDLTQVQPAEYRADAVVILLDDEDRPVQVIVVEIQLADDLMKRFSWPAYVAVSRAIHKCPADLLVLAPNATVAAWCAKPIETGARGFVLSPCVVNLADVPFVTDPEEAARRPELAVLSALAHGDSEHGAAIAAAVLPAIQALDDDRARLYYDLVYNSLNTAARRALEELMKGYEYQSDFAKKYVAQGRVEGHIEGRLEGRVEGRAEGRSEGRSEGRAEEAARNLLTVLRVRGFNLPDHIRERILAQTDPERLERWLEKAVTVASLASLIDEPN